MSDQQDGKIVVVNSTLNPVNPTPTHVKVVANRPPPDGLLSPSFLFDKVVKGLMEDAGMSPKFSKTIEQYHVLEEAKKDAKCTGCELNRRGKPMMTFFVQEMKTLEQDEQSKVMSMLGKRVVIPIDQKWVNLADNTVVPFELKEVPINSVIPNGKNPPIVSSAKSPPVVVSSEESKQKFIFTNYQGPGDVVMLTAAIRDLHLNHPGKFITDVKTSSQHIWEGNPYVEWGKHTLDPKHQPLDEKDPTVKTVKLGYPLIHQSNEGPYHFSEAFTEELEDILEVRIKRRLCRGDIHIRKEEDVWGWTERQAWFKPYNVDPASEFWIIDAGHKLDFTAKFWGCGKFQAVVEHYKGKIQFVQIGHKAHVHPKLEGVINLVGQTDDRQLIRLVWASSGVLTPVSLPMVLAAAIPVKPGTCKGKKERPCVVVAGGREPSGWQAYTNHQYIHTCGSLPCCDRGGCWVSRTKPIGDGDEKDTRNLCQNVTVDEFEEEVPYCMSMITPDDVIRRIDMYNQFYGDDRKKYTYNKPEAK